MKEPELRLECKLKQGEEDTNFYNGDESRDLAYKNLQERFERRFPGLLLVWDEDCTIRSRYAKSSYNCPVIGTCMYSFRF